MIAKYEMVFLAILFAVNQGLYEVSERHQDLLGMGIGVVILSVITVRTMYLAFQMLKEL